ncbi:hypothetical protein cce_2131 [Crocosphaera subtropica ATCC 51142]|uniref:DUF3341 domain-containing protein n=1 Tax=Crocosphaera subtropica (strain ATCC 51142 / BH68) TaxID=43989 RepID=B1WNQ2_CROS5|nr:hypothetical protein [Crocosphaera subtropica]ACB51481.1 hypothetical protein cce_2131 [Crocosphaera subtropica ATCC 51142]
MSQQSSVSSTQLSSTWGKFPNLSAAKETKKKLEEAGVAPNQITVEVENFDPPLKLKQTQAINNLRTGAITGTILGALIGLLISLIVTDFAHLGLGALNNFQAIHYASPLIAGGIGAVGMSVILAISGAKVPKFDKEITDGENQTLPKLYLIVVEGTPKEIELAKKMIVQQSGFIEAEDR